MRLLSEIEAASWCSEHGVVSTGSLPAARLSFAHGIEQRIRVALGGPALEAVTLANVLLMSNLPDDDERYFSGGLLWLQDWDIWSSTTERVGLLLSRGLRSVSGLDGDVRDFPAELYDGSDVAASQAALVVPILFQWDAFFVPESAEYLFYASHHGHVDVVARSHFHHQAMLERLREAGMNPTVV